MHNAGLMIFIMIASGGLSALFMLQVGYFVESFTGRDGENLALSMFFAGFSTGMLSTILWTRILPLWLVPIVTPLSAALAVGLLFVLAFGLVYICTNAARISRSLGRKARDFVNEYRFHRDIDN